MAILSPFTKRWLLMFKWANIDWFSAAMGRTVKKVAETIIFCCIGIKCIVGHVVIFDVTSHRVYFHISSSIRALSGGVTYRTCNNRLESFFLIYILILQILNQRFLFFIFCNYFLIITGCSFKVFCQLTYLFF